MPWRTVGAVALIVVGVGAVIFALFGPAFGKSDTTQYITSQATTTNVVNEAQADGTLSAARTYGLSFGADPAIVDPSSSSSSNSGSGGTWLVKDVSATVGQQVKAGDVLATADTTDQQNALDLAQANLSAAQAKYEADNGGPTSTDQQSAQLSVDQAQQQLDAATKSRDNTASQNQIKLQQSQNALSQARSKLSDDRSSHAPSALITSDKQAVTQAESDLKLTKAQIQASNQSANQQVASAQLSLQSAQNGYTSQTAPASAQTLSSDKASVLQAQQAVDDAQQQLDGAVIKAPEDGTIVAVNVVAGTTAPSGDAVEMMTNDLNVTADFAESDVPNIAAGQKASVTITATGDQVPGTVTTVTPVASTSGASSVVSYSVTVALDNDPAKSLPGMSAQVAITIDEADNVVAIPAIALEGSNGNYAVRVLNADGSVTQTPVQVGLITSSLAEIKSGISDGQAVVTGTTSSLNSTSTTGGTGFPGGGITGGGNFPAGGFRPGGGGRVVTNGN
jgi:RND family efflux transporter MFP subunit